MSQKASGTIAFQGEPGAYSEASVLEHFGADTLTLPCESFDAVFAAVTEGRAHLGMIAIENSLAGSIHHNYDLLLQHDLTITGEHYLRVRHCLIAQPGVQIGDVRQVISHPQALAQCEGYLRKHEMQAQVFYDTAGAVKHLKEAGDQRKTAAGSTSAAGTFTAAGSSTAAIASRRAADVYGMCILEEGIEDNPANFTRFLVIGKEPSNTSQPGKYKTTIVFSLNNQPGSLFKALSVFALRDIDLTKIESRPLVGRPWEYLFYIDFALPVTDPSAGRALSHLEEYAVSLRVLGSYSRHIVE